MLGMTKEGSNYSMTNIKMERVRLDVAVVLDDHMEATKQQILQKLRPRLERLEIAIAPDWPLMKE